MGDTQVFVTPDAMTIEVIDRTSPSLEINIDEKRVTVEGAVRPVVNVSYTGGRGPIWLPGNTYDGTSLAAILAGYIGKAQLAQDLLADIDSTITGLVDARVELATAIQANIENGTRIDDVVSRITQAEGTLELSVAKLNAAEANISNAQVFIDDASVRLSAAEGSISNASNYIATQETILSNEWTVKIQENSDGTTCVAGTGLLVYPTWKLDTVYDVDDYSWFDGNAYKAVIAHTASEENVPPNSSYWQLIPYATKSQFGVLAESFFVQTGTGEKAIPFIVQDDQVMINGDLTVNGLINAGALSANKIWTWSAQSKNYVPGVSGYLIDSLTGIVEFNNMSLTINYSDIVGTPDPTSIVQTAIDATLDTTSGGIIVRDIDAQRYAHFTGGDLTFYDYVDSGWVPYKSVTKIVTGTCVDGETVNIGYFREQPSVLLSPFLLSSYNSVYKEQSQTFNLSPNNLRKIGNDWYFDTSAKLELAAKNITTPLTIAKVGTFDPYYATTLQLNTDAVNTPVSNSYDISVTLRIKRRFYLYFNGSRSCRSISVEVYLEYYANNTWNSVFAGSLSSSYCYASDLFNNITSNVSSAYPITAIRAYAIYTVNDYRFDINIGTTSFVEQGIYIDSLISRVNASTISVKGKASYMAIG